MSYELSHLYRFDSFCLDPVEHQLLRDGVSVPLTPKVFDTLMVLVERSGHLVEKEELMNLVWAETFVEEANLARCIHTLRKALGEDQGGKRYIETVPKRGYRFVADVQVIENGGTNVMPSDEAERLGGRAATIEAVRPATPTEDGVGTHDSTASPRRHIHASVFIVPLALVVAAVAAYFYLARGHPAATDQTPITSIAVLPFANVGADPNLDYLSDGLSESVIDHLSQLSQLRVIARSSSFKYRGENIDLQEVATKLGVQAIVMGRVVPRGDNLTVRVELLDARENKQLWGALFNRPMADAQKFQQEIAQAISEKLRLKLSGTQEQQLAKRNTVNPEAYELLFRGNFYFDKGGADNLMKAVEYYEQAIAIAPNYALAYAHLSSSYRNLVGPSVLDPKEFTPRARAAAQKAFELDPNLANAHLELANHDQDAWDWKAAEAKYQHAIELNPNNPIARTNYSMYLSIIGRHHEALAEMERAKELDPLTLSSYTNFAYTLFLARRYDEAIVGYRKALEMDKTHFASYPFLGHAYAGKKMYREAIAAYHELIHLGGTTPSTEIYLGAVYARAGEREKALAILWRLETNHGYVSPGELAVLYTALGEREKAFASLEKAYVAHDLQLQYLKVDPYFDPLRDESRFRDLLRRVGLPE